MLFIYRSNLRFVSFDDVYLQRFSNADLGNDIFSRYMFSWLINLFIPLVLLYGIVMKKKTYLIIGSFSCVCVYMSIAAKGTILMPIILWGMYFLLKKFSFKNIYFSMITVLTVILSLLLIFTNKDSTILFLISSLLMWRVIGTGGNLNLAYFDAKFIFLSKCLVQHKIHRRSNSSNYKFHRNSLLNLLKHHIYNIQNFEKKSKLLAIINFRIKFMDLINYLKKKNYVYFFKLLIYLIRSSILEFMALFTKQIIKSIKSRIYY
jgi:hypothetical protein